MTLFNASPSAFLPLIQRSPADGERVGVAHHGQQVFERHEAGETAQGIGYSNEVAGGFAQFMPLAEWLLLEVSNGLPAERAALTEPIAVGWHAVQHARLTPEDVPLRQRASRRRKVGGN